jgi:hypothetical protein
MKRFLFVFVLTVALLGLLAAPAVASAHTFYVAPNTTTHDDTANIQAAFAAAVKAGPGSTVLLGPYHNCTNTIFVQNLKGYFKDAGEGRTVVDTLQAPGQSNGQDLTRPGRCRRRATPLGLGHRLCPAAIPAHASAARSGKLAGRSCLTLLAAASQCPTADEQGAKDRHSGDPDSR